MATDVRVSVWTASPSILIDTVRGKAHPHIARTGESPVRAVDDEPHVAAEELVVLGRQPVDPSGARVDVEPDRVDVVGDDEDAVQPAVERARRERRRAARPGEGRAPQQLAVEGPLLAADGGPAVRAHRGRRRRAAVGVDPRR
jgi:hypothetical protein